MRSRIAANSKRYGTDFTEFVEEFAPRGHEGDTDSLQQPTLEQPER